jgi:hypothetical protein
LALVGGLKRTSKQVDDSRRTLGRLHTPSSIPQTPNNATYFASLSSSFQDQNFSI